MIKDSITIGTWIGIVTAMHNYVGLITDAKEVLDSGVYVSDDPKTKGIITALIELGYLRYRRKYIFSKKLSE